MSDEERRTNVLLEHLVSQFRTFGEGLDGLRDEVKQFREETTTKFEKMDGRFDKLENKVIDLTCELSTLKADNKQDHKKTHQAVKDLENEIKRLDTEVVQIKRVK
jgi:predicted  nucleic acid-binding Zn-ribbon protein